MWYISKHITILFRSAGHSWKGDRIYVSIGESGYLKIRNGVSVVYSDEEIIERIQWQI